MIIHIFLALCYIIDMVSSGLDCKKEEDKCRSLLEDYDVNITVVTVINGTTHGTTYTVDNLCWASQQLQNCTSEIYDGCPCNQLNLTMLTAAAQSLEHHCENHSIEGEYVRYQQGQGLAYGQKIVIVFSACLLLYILGVTILLCTGKTPTNQASV